MPETRWTGGVVPSPGDDLLGAWEAYDDSAGRVLPAPSLAAAKVMLASAPPGAVTPARPAVFIIGKVFYVADGTKTPGGEYVLTPANMWAGILHRHWDKTNGRGRPTSDKTQRHWGHGTIHLPLRSLIEFTLDVCVSIVHSDFATEADKDKAVGSYFFGFSLSGASLWRTERQYNRTFMTHQFRWVQEVNPGTYTATYTTSGGYGPDPFWHYDGGVFPGTRFTVTNLGATD
jgi:hypothetical protein